MILFRGYLVFLITITVLQLNFSPMTWAQEETYNSTSQQDHTSQKLENASLDSQVVIFSLLQKALSESFLVGTAMNLQDPILTETGIYFRDKGQQEAKESQDKAFYALSTGVVTGIVGLFLSIQGELGTWKAGELSLSSGAGALSSGFGSSVAASVHWGQAPSQEKIRAIADASNVKALQISAQTEGFLSVLDLDHGERQALLTELYRFELGSFDLSALLQTLDRLPQITIPAWQRKALEDLNELLMYVQSYPLAEKAPSFSLLDRFELLRRVERVLKNHFDSIKKDSEDFAGSPSDILGRQLAKIQRTYSEIKLLVLK